MGGPVDDDMANLIVAQLLYLDSASKKDIIMYVNSPGGSVTAGQDNSSHCRWCPVVTSESRYILNVTV